MKRLLLMTLVLAAAVLGCGKEEAPTVEIPDLSPEEIVARASPRLDEVDSLHFKLEHEGGGTPILVDIGLDMIEVSGDIVPPDRAKMEIDARWGNQRLDVQLVTVSGTTLITNPVNGKWEVLPEDWTAVELFKPDVGIKAVMESVTNPVKLEEQRVGGALCFRLEGDIPSEALDAIAAGHAAEGEIVHVEFWVGVEDFLLRKVVFDGIITEYEEPGITRTLTVSRFDEPVTIELPEYPGRL